MNKIGVSARDLGVTLDQCFRCSFVWAISTILHPLLSSVLVILDLDQISAEKLIHALVFLKLDCCNSLLNDPLMEKSRNFSVFKPQPLHCLQKLEEWITSPQTSESFISPAERVMRFLIQALNFVAIFQLVNSKWNLQTQEPPRSTVSCSFLDFNARFISKYRYNSTNV